MKIVIFCLFLAFQEITTKHTPNATNFFDDFSGLEGTLEASGEDLKSHMGATSLPDVPQGVPPMLVGPLWHHLT